MTVTDRPRVPLIEDVAVRYGVSTKTVREWCRAGLIPATRPHGTRRWLFTWDALEEWERARQGPEAA